MPQYRFHLLTSAGRLSLTSHSEFDTDDHAVVFADGLLRAAAPQVRSVEVWQGLNLLSKRERSD